MNTQRWSRAGLLANERGAALFAAVLAMLLLSTMMVAFAVVARDEVVISQNAREAATAEFAAEAGANYGRFILSRRLTSDLNAEIAKMDRLTMINLLNTAYNTHAGSAQFLLDKALPQSGGPTFAACGGMCQEPPHTPGGEIPDGQQVVLTLTGTDPTYTSRVIVGVPNGPNGLPVIKAGGTAAEMIYMWRVESTGRTGRATQRISHDSVIADTPSGTFRIYLSSGFVQYAHFIDQMDSNQAWMSFRHFYTGPVHTNTRFNILGNPTGPTFRSEATQTLNDIRFNNGGSTTTQPRDSTGNDWPLLGPSPGVLCKAVDCTGLTRNHDFDPVAPGIQPIPFPNAADPTTLGDRTAEMDKARGLDAVPPAVTPGPNCIPPVAAPIPCGYVAVPPAGSQAITVFVANDNPTGWGNGNLKGGIFVAGNVRDLLFAATPQGQKIVICTTTAANQGCNAAAGVAGQRRTVIQEDRALGTTTVRRECFTNHVPPAAPVHCNAGGGAQWKLDPYLLPDRQLQVLTGVPAGTGNFTPSQQIDRGVLFITGNVGLQGMEFGLRQCPNIAGPGVAPNINYCQGVTTAIYNDPADPLQGSRWTVAADGNVFLTGHLILQRDPRAADLEFTAPVPGPGDDLDVQNVLGVISWGGGLRMSSWLSPANLANRYPGIDNANLYLQGMFMAPAINGGAAPIGQLSFDDSNGAYRGQARLLGGVIQKTMGTLGSPGTPGTGYARDWVYDERYRHRGMSPPLFPGFPRFTATGGPGKDDFTFRSGSF